MWTTEAVQVRKSGDGYSLSLSHTTSVVVGRVVEVECSSGQVWCHLTPPLNFVVVNVHEMGCEICEAAKIAMWH